MTNPSKHEETTGMPILNFTHKSVCAKIMLQHRGRQAQIRKLDAKFFRERKSFVLCCLSYLKWQIRANMKKQQECQL
jgi:hypothetical protein